jgi:hypothetical protein
VLQAQRNREPTEILSAVASRTGEAAFEVVTDANTELQLRHDRDRIERGRVKQRWLLPTKLLAAGRRPTALTRAGAKVGVVSNEGLLVLDLATGSIERRTGRITLAKGRAGELLGRETTTFVIGDEAQAMTLPEAGVSNRERGAGAHVAPFSVTLPDGRVAAVYHDSLVIAVPGGEASSP